MDFAYDDDQAALIESARTLLARSAGPDRARVVEDRHNGYDSELQRSLIEAGFADPEQAGATPLEAELVVEQVARAVGCVPFSARALVAPPILGASSPDVVVVLGRRAGSEPVRFAAEADAFLMIRDDQVVVIPAEQVTVSPLASAFGYPIARVAIEEGAGETVAGARPQDLLSRNRVAVAAELVGLLDGALALTVEYVSERKQFGHPLGSLQAVQHRLAELHFRIDGARWLARRAAASGALEDAAAAATAAVAAADRAVGDLHQLTGAMGLTREYDLFLWTLRAHSLAQEAGNLPATSLAVARWGAVTCLAAVAGQ